MLPPKPLSPAAYQFPCTLVYIYRSFSEYSKWAHAPPLFFNDIHAFGCLGGPLKVRQQGSVSNGFTLQGRDRQVSSSWPIYAYLTQWAEDLAASGRMFVYSQFTWLQMSSEEHSSGNDLVINLWRKYWRKRHQVYVESGNLKQYFVHSRKITFVVKASKPPFSLR